LIAVLVGLEPASLNHYSLVRDFTTRRLYTAYATEPPNLQWNSMATRIDL